MASLKNNNIIQAWLVLFLSICFGGFLTGVQLFLSPIIDANKADEIKQRIPSVVLGEETAAVFKKQDKTLDVETISVQVPKGGATSLYTVYKAFARGEFLGWAAKSSGGGYADKIELLVGFDPQAAALTGIFILDQKETPGLGAKITESSWRRQFVQKSTAHPVTIVKAGAKQPFEINAITGATISSQSVARIVNKTVNDIKGPLSGKLPAARPATVIEKGDERHGG